MKEFLLKLQELELCVHHFGKLSDPAVLLINGAAGQAILWDENLCQNLANDGYFIIRFDPRDTGLSSNIDYLQNPYNLKDMAEDALKILDHFKIQKAHIVGMSMGGYVAQNMAIYFPQRIITLTLLMTTINSLALRGVRGVTKLPGQDVEVIKQMALTYQAPRKTLADRVKSLTDTWQLFNVNEAPFPYQEWYKLAEKSYSRANGNNAMRNHRLAILNSPADRTELLKNIDIPTLIIHGEADPIIKVAHAHYAHQHIPQAKLLIIDKMGHILSSIFTSEIENALLKHFKTIEKS